MTYHQFTNADGTTYGSFETFHHYRDAFSIHPDEFDYETGWYWRACFPGCLPDGEPSGPFDSEQEAIKDATPFI